MDGPSKSTSHKNISGLIGVIIGEKTATLQELRTIYSIKDAMIMYESIMVPRVNEYWAHKDAEAEAKRNKK